MVLEWILGGGAGGAMLGPWPMSEARWDAAAAGPVAGARLKAELDGAALGGALRARGGGGADMYMMRGDEVVEASPYASSSPTLVAPRRRGDRDVHAAVLGVVGARVLAPLQIVFDPHPF